MMKRYGFTIAIALLLTASVAALAGGPGAPAVHEQPCCTQYDILLPAALPQAPASVS